MSINSSNRIVHLARAVARRLLHAPSAHDRPPPTHRARAHIHEARTFGERAADAVSTGLGSWTFLGVQTFIIFVWIGLNVAAVAGHWDPYPFILLNLLFSTQAAYAAPILQLSDNRQAAKDRVRDDTEAQEVELLVTLLQRNTALTEQVAALTRTMHDHITSERPTMVLPALGATNTSAEKAGSPV